MKTSFEEFSIKIEENIEATNAENNHDSITISALNRGQIIKVAPGLILSSVYLKMDPSIKVGPPIERSEFENNY